MDVRQMNLGLSGGPLNLVNCLNSCEADSLMASAHFHEVFAWTDKTVYLKVSCIMPGTNRALIHFLHLLPHSKLNPYLWFMEWGRANTLTKKRKRTVSEISGYLEREQTENKAG